MNSRWRKGRRGCGGDTWWLEAGRGLYPELARRPWTDSRCSCRCVGKQASDHLGSTPRVLSGSVFSSFVLCSLGSPFSNPINEIGIIAQTRAADDPGLSVLLHVVYSSFPRHESRGSHYRAEMRTGEASENWGGRNLSSWAHLVSAAHGGGAGGPPPGPDTFTLAGRPTPRPQGRDKLGPRQGQACEIGLHEDALLDFSVP